MSKSKAQKLRERALFLKYRFVYNGIKSDQLVFTKAGFNHLIYSSHGVRHHTNIVHRMSYIPQVLKILEVCPDPVEIRGIRKGDATIKSLVCYCAYEADIFGRRVRLVTSQRPVDEKPCFLSLIELH